MLHGISTLQFELYIGYFHDLKPFKTSNCLAIGRLRGHAVLSCTNQGSNHFWQLCLLLSVNARQAYYT